MIDSPYFLRSKRRKLNNEKESFDYFLPQSTPKKRKNAVMHLPTEALLLVFEFLSYKELAKTVRIVNKRFRTLAEYILNVTFKGLERRLSLIQNEAVFLVNNESLDAEERRNRHKILNAIEILMLYYDLAMATIWRYVYVPRGKLCMYAGEILDNYVLFLRKYKSPEFLVISNKCNYKVVPKIVETIKDQTKVFCTHFELVSEMPINSVLKSGAKLVDLLDIGRYSVKTKHEERFTKTTYYCKLNYYFSYSWFAAIDGKNAKVARKMSWQEHQKHMYMRFRRLVVNHTELQMNESQYLRELERMHIALYIIPKPTSFIYTGYGQENSWFFFYGTMNQQCYNKKYMNANEDELEGSVQAENNLGVNVMVTLKCPIQLAPRKALQRHFKQNEHNSTRRGSFEFKLQINSPGNARIRVPEEFRFIVKEKKK